MSVACSDELFRSGSRTSTFSSVTPSTKLEKMSRTSKGASSRAFPNLCRTLHISEITFQLLKEYSRAPHVPVPELPPAPPQLFFGRDGLVQEVVGAILRKSNVALIGMGGIGKTSVAKVVTSDASIVEHFGKERYFVKCDDFMASLDNFLDRVAQVLGAKGTGPQAVTMNTLRPFLRKADILLVFDNVESVTDAPIDSDRIAEAIGEFASYPSVSLIVTTRITILPTDIVFERINVPPLDKDAAWKAFSAVYGRVESSGVAPLRELLFQLDYHPLSINLLAQAGVQNEWSPSELEAAWERERTRILHLDRPGRNVSKIQSLSVTIELSLHSPTIQGLGDDAREVMRAIAFLPRGVNRSKLQEIFPSVKNIHDIFDTLGRLSLTLRSDDGFVTMLAPIRLHMSADEDYGGLLGDLRAYYYTELDGSSQLSPGDEGFDQTKWIGSEDDNVERLINHFLISSFSDRNATLDASAACENFLHLLYAQKPRRTILGPLVDKLPEDDNELTVAKAWCLRRLGELERYLGDLAEARELLSDAQELFLHEGMRNPAASCLLQVARICRDLGEYVEAERQFREASAIFSELRENDGEAHCNHGLGRMLLKMGKGVEAAPFLEDAQEYFESIEDWQNVSEIRISLGRVELSERNLEDAQDHFEAARDIAERMENWNWLGECLRWEAEVSLKLEQWGKAHKLLGEARKHFLNTNDIRWAATCLMARGSAHCDQQEFAIAMTELSQALEEFVLIDSKRDQARCLGHMSDVEFYQRNYPVATQLCVRAKDLFSEAGDRHGEVRCLRDLGLIALQEKDMGRAKTHITEAKRVCEDVGYSLKRAGLGKYFDTRGCWVEPPSTPTISLGPPPTPVSPG
jgi:tetratricopeptide (TPR) repeat protein